MPSLPKRKPSRVRGRKGAKGGKSLSRNEGAARKARRDQQNREKRPRSVIGAMIAGSNTRLVDRPRTTTQSKQGTVKTGKNFKRKNSKKNQSRLKK